MKKIYLLTNYRGAFGNKYKAAFYASGMDKIMLTDNFKKEGFKTVFLSPSEIDFRDNKLKNSTILYTTTPFF